MKRLLITILTVFIAFTASAQYRDSVYEDRESMTQSFLNSDGQVDVAKLQNAINELEHRVNNDKSWFTAGCVLSFVGGMVYLAGMNTITTSDIRDYNATLDQTSSGLTTAYIGCGIGSVGALIALIAGCSWGENARDLRALRFQSLGSNVGVVFSF